MEICIAITTIHEWVLTKGLKVAIDSRMIIIIPCRFILFCMALIIIIGSTEDWLIKKREETKTLFYYLQLDVINFVSKINV